MAKLKEIQGLEDYYASEDGTIWSTKISRRYNPNGEMRMIRPRTHPSGYLYYGLFVGKGPNKQRLWRRGHRLIYQTFVGKIKQGYEIDHIDGNKHNNELKNLRMITRSDNMLAMWERKRKANEKN